MKKPTYGFTLASAQAAISAVERGETLVGGTEALRKAREVVAYWKWLRTKQTKKTK